MGRFARRAAELDRELEDLPAEMRWREWKGRAEAVIFAAAEPVTRETLARVVGRHCAIDLLIEDLIADLSGRPYELLRVGQGYAFRTRAAYGAAVRAAFGLSHEARTLTRLEAAVLMGIALFQPVTRGDLSETLGREISRDLIASLREQGLIAAGPRSPRPGAPYAYVTTAKFLSEFGFESLQDLPNLEALKDAGLIAEPKPGAVGDEEAA